VVDIDSVGTLMTPAAEANQLRKVDQFFLKDMVIREMMNILNRRTALTDSVTPRQHDPSFLPPFP